ncbi:MAG: hypothetical protein K1Y02_20360 [Candidatus Hydrogenedentes bacterium]|nr:hypothetical protein [Candidatus Hydrogenedentota bacterium]
MSFVLDRTAVPTAVLSILLSCLYFLWYGLQFALGDIAELRGQEPIILSGIMKILAGLPLYTHPNDPPFDIIQYTPLHYYLVASVAHIGGVSTDGLITVTHLGRIMSLGLASLYVFILFLILFRQLHVRLFVAATGAGLVWVLHAPWDFLARPDILVSFCFLLAVGLAVRVLDRAPHAGFLSFAGIGLLSYVAFMAKQNGAQIALIAVLFLILDRRWKLAAIVALAAALPVLLTIWLGPALFGSAYLANVVGGLNNGVRVYHAFVTTYSPVFLGYNMAALAGLGAFVVWKWSKSDTASSLRFLAFAAVGTTLLAGLGATKLGSATNHFNDPMTLLVVVLAVWLDKTMTNRPENASGIRLAICVFTILFTVNTTIAFHETYSQHKWPRFSGYERVRSYLRDELASHPGAYFVSVDGTLANSFPGRAILPQFSLAGLMYERGTVDFSQAEKMMREGKVRWLLLGDGQSPERQLGFLGIDPGPYTRVGAMDGFSVWIDSRFAGEYQPAPVAELSPNSPTR